ncbi:hypothetical protein GM51_16570 [freshwater metagenome]|uniref:Uncharacterized protein n=1 Tax=freshwater metagenome TaxID=449393 RepID=A0A094PY85_9ZZZZ
MNRGIQLDALSVPIEIGLRIVLSIERNNEVIESAEISKHGVLISVQDRMLESKTLVPRPLVTDKISISKIKGSKLYALAIDLPGKQKVYVSKELKECAISIQVFRQFVDAWHPTNLAMLVLRGKENVLYQDKRFLTGVVEKPIEVTAEEPSPKKVELEVVAEEVPLKKDKIEVVQAETVSVISEPNKPRFNFKVIARGIAFAFALAFSLVAVTPLSLVHPNKLENQISSIYLVWPTNNPTVGSEVLGVDEDELIYVAEVHSNEGGIILLKIDEYYIQTELDRIVGKKIVEIPLLGNLFT